MLLTLQFMMRTSRAFTVFPARTVPISFLSRMGIPARTVPISLTRMGIRNQSDPEALAKVEEMLDGYVNEYELPFNNDEQLFRNELNILLRTVSPKDAFEYRLTYAEPELEDWEVDEFDPGMYKYAVMASKEFYVGDRNQKFLERDDRYSLEGFGSGSWQDHDLYVMYLYLGTDDNETDSDDETGSDDEE